MIFCSVLQVLNVKIIYFERWSITNHLLMENIYYLLVFVDKVCGYFGVKIAMYFAYLGHYTTALTIPATIALLSWVISGHSQVMHSPIFVKIHVETSMYMYVK